MKTADMCEIGEIIKFFRKNCGLTQSELAEKVGIDDKQIGKIERGVHFPSVPTFLKLIAVLNININEFYGTKESVLGQQSENKLLSLVRNLSSKQADMAYKIIKTISQY